MLRKYELTDDMLSDIEAKVKKNNPWLDNNLAQANWKLENADQYQPKNRFTSINEYIAKINHAYTRLERASNEGKLTDTFREIETSETQSRTARSLEKTLDKYARQYSIIQAHIA